MFLLDTNIVSELRLPDRANPNVLFWAEQVPSTLMYLSVISLQELEIGVLRMERRDPVQAIALRTWFDGKLRPHFDERVLPIDTAVALRSAGLQVPDPKSYRDVLIAATAMVHGMTVVTRNVSDFKLSGVPVLNPFEASPKETRS